MMPEDKMSFRDAVDDVRAGTNYRIEVLYLNLPNYSSFLCGSALGPTSETIRFILNWFGHNSLAESPQFSKTSATKYRLHLTHTFPHLRMVIQAVHCLNTLFQTLTTIQIGFLCRRSALFKSLFPVSATGCLSGSHCVGSIYSSLTLLLLTVVTQVVMRTTWTSQSLIPGKYPVYDK